MKTIFFAICCSTLYFVSCSGSIPEPTPGTATTANGRWPGSTIRTLREGRKLYILKCGGCHSLHSPGSYSEEQWQKIIPIMAGKARLDSSQTEYIKRYILATSLYNRSNE